MKLEGNGEKHLGIDLVTDSFINGIEKGALISMNGEMMIVRHITTNRIIVGAMPYQLHQMGLIGEQRSPTPSKVLNSTYADNTHKKVTLEVKTLEEGERHLRGLGDTTAKLLVKDGKFLKLKFLEKDITTAMLVRKDMIGIDGILGTVTGICGKKEFEVKMNGSDQLVLGWKNQGESVNVEFSRECLSKGRLKFLEGRFPS